ncbi:MAG: hypothetical protein US89_C0016G0033 [Candidatus Peregrinibacteria bacterium GW2011_GWF2_38_29]|nr:MAG: hypothetical protein US89_C0016G0033 [Candidatus Peregrinibacteria bacterium GW2011_GWF2_38_29]
MIHTDLANGRWFTMTFAEQMGNTGSEIHRLVLSQNGDKNRFDSAFDRALELIDLTLADPRWKKSYKEIARVREVLCDICFGQSQYDTSLENLDDYFFQFGLIAR